MYVCVYLCVCIPWKLLIVLLDDQIETVRVKSVEAKEANLKGVEVKGDKSERRGAERELDLKGENLK